MNINYDIASKIGYIGGMFVIILTGLALIIVGVVRGYLITTDFQILSIPLSLGIALFSIGIAMHSCKISEESKNIANKTDRKIDEFNNTYFLSIISLFEDRRLDTILNKEIIHINLWKALVDLKQAKVMADNLNIEQKHLITMISRFNNLMDRIITLENMILCEDVKHICKMYTIITELNVDGQYNELKEETIVKLRTFLHIDENVNITSGYIQQILSNITEEIRWHLFDIHRNEIVEIT